MKLAGKLRRIHGHLVLALLGLWLAQPNLSMNLLGTAVVLVGMALRVWAAGYLEKGGELCTDGPYRYVRHPLYLGSLLAALGFAVMINAVWGWAAVLPLFLALYGIQVLSEERHLAAKYGATHADFAASVPVLLPRFGRPGEGKGRPWRLSQALANREQYHVVVTLLLAALFFFKLFAGG